MPLDYNIPMRGQVPDIVGAMNKGIGMGNNLNALRLQRQARYEEKRKAQRLGELQAQPIPEDPEAKAKYIQDMFEIDPKLAAGQAALFDKEEQRKKQLQEDIQMKAQKLAKFETSLPTEQRSPQNFYMAGTQMGLPMDELFPGLQGKTQWTPEDDYKIRALAGVDTQKQQFAPEIVYGPDGGIYQASRKPGQTELSPYTIKGKQATKFTPAKVIKGEDEYKTFDPRTKTITGTGTKTDTGYKKELEGKKLNIAYKQLELATQKAKKDQKILDQKIKSGEANIEDAYRTYEDKTKSGVKVIDQILSHPGLKGSVGAKNWSSAFGLMKEPVGGSKEADFVSKYNQINGQAFLQAFASIRGGGQITEVEGKKATQAITSMSRATSEDEFRYAANEFKRILLKGLERAKKKYAKEKGVVNNKKPKSIKTPKAQKKKPPGLTNAEWKELQELEAELVN